MGAESKPRQGGALAAGQAAVSAANGPCRGADLRTGGAKPASGSETLAGGVGGESTNQPGRSANISSLEVALCVRDVQGAQQSGADGPSVSGARSSPARQGDAQFVLLSNLQTNVVVDSQTNFLESLLQCGFQVVIGRRSWSSNHQATLILGDESL